MDRFVGLLICLVGIIWLIDVHAHECEACGRRWRHTGLTSGGAWAQPKALRAHTCRCGAEQWRRAT